jgi:hypothetical protein
MGIFQDLKDNVLGTKEQNRIAQENLDKQARGGSKIAKFLGGNDQGMYVPEKEQAGGMPTMDVEQKGGMPSTKPSKKSEEFNLYKTVKKAADEDGMKKGGTVKKAKGGKVSSASKRADGIAIRGKTRA